MKRLLKIISYINHHPLAGRHRWSAYLKFIKWQIWQLVFRREKKVELLQGVYMSVGKGMSGTTGNIYLGLHEFNDMGFMLHFLRKDDLFFDMGANVGSYTMLASGICEARTIAFEPSPSTFDSLQKNIELNHLGGLVHAERTAIGSTAGVTTFTASQDARNHVLPDWITDVPSIEVKVATAQEYMHKHGIPLMIKMDVEGFEMEVLVGMQDKLSSEKLKVVILELNTSSMRYGNDDLQIHHHMLHHGFIPVQYDPFTRVLETIATYGSHNTIYVKDIDWIRGRLQSAKPFQIFGESI